MKALVLHGKNGSFKYEEEWPDPKATPGWAIVKVGFAGICGSDLPRFKSEGSYHHPVILGHEFSGTVYEIADGHAFNVGDRVTIVPIIPCGHCDGCVNYGPFHCTHYQYLGSRNDGGMSEYCLVPIENMRKIPDLVSLQLAAMIEPLMVGYHVVKRSGITPGKSAVVFGAGAIGLLIAFWLKELGVEDLTIVDIRSFSINLAKEMGFHSVVQPQEIAELRNRFDFGFEAAGAQSALLSMIDLVKPKATISVVGRDTHDTLLPLKKVETLMRKELTVQGCWGFDDSDIPFILETLSSTRIDLEKMITSLVPIEESEKTVRKMLNHEFQYVKVMIDFKESQLP
ncbi:MAG: alcohol dehydrogenase catalytic domain-containing protein [Sphaerochaeta sp.]|jgi:L-iditol 2-dehydrogenase